MQWIATRGQETGEVHDPAAELEATANAGPVVGSQATCPLARTASSVASR